jgi:hypothetical protein
MSTPRYTVIVPVLRFRTDEPVLVSLRETVPPGGMPQILVVEGRHPARQRNAALLKAQGEIIVFLDNDCRLGPRFWEALETAFARPEVQIVGGPALLRLDATEPEKIFHALLTHPLVVGPICSRYAARGAFRVVTETELILCNLAARHVIFTKIGTLSPELYPNEENEWLDRAQAAHVAIYYDPAQQVFRPQRSTWWEMARMLFRYGMGRTRQLQVSGWQLSAQHLLPLVLIVPGFASILGTPFEIGLLALWLLLSMMIGATCNSHLRPGQKCVAGLVAPFIPLIYIIGQTAGWAALLVPLPPDSEIHVYNEKGERLSDGG